MSYPTQWTTPNVAPPGNSISAQGEVIPNTTIFNPFSANAQIRQPNPPMQMQLGQAHTNHNSPNFCSAAPAGYPFVYSPLMAAFAAPSGAVQPRQTPGFCIPQSPPTNAAAAAAFRGTALLSSPAAFQPPPPPPPSVPNQHQLAQLPYFSPLNGIQLASNFPPTATAPFPHASLPQHAGTFLPTQFRGYDSLKHFGALPQVTNHKKNKSMTTSKTNLYITGLSESDTDETVRALVENIVRPKSCKAMLLNGKCKGSGFIDCATEEDAVKALNHLMEMSKNGGRQLVVKYALENEKDLLNVYVRNLPKTGFTKETLLNLFRPYGQVTSVKLLETDGAHTGIGFVRFASAEQAQRAVDSMNERRCILACGNGSGESPTGNGTAKPISCKLADKADPKRRAAAAVAAAGGTSVVPSSSPSSGFHRGKFHTPRHHQPPPHQLVCGDLHLQNHQQQHQPIAAALPSLSPHQQYQPGLIYQSGMLPDSTGMIAAAAAGGYVSATSNGPPACYSQPSRPPTEAHEPSRSATVPIAAATTVNATTTSTSSVTGLLDMSASQSPSNDYQQQHHLLPQPSSVNGQSPAAAVDSRYAAHLAAVAAAAVAAAASNNAVMYPPSNAIVPGTHHFPRPSQPPLVQPTYSVASGGVSGLHHHYGQPNPVDFAAEQLQSLTLAATAAARQSHQYYSDWQTAGFHTAPITAGATAYQPSATGEAFVDGSAAAAAAAALLNSYVQMPQSFQLPLPHSLPPQQSVHSASSQMTGGLEQQEQKQLPNSSNEAPAKEVRGNGDNEDNAKMDEIIVAVAPAESNEGKEEGAEVGVVELAAAT